jgi:hypothetical protein
VRGTEVSHEMHLEIWENDDWVEYTFVVTAYVTPAMPGRTSGPPERCYPPEPAEVEYNEVVRCVETRRSFWVWEWELLKRWGGDEDYSITDEDEALLETHGDAEEAAYDAACDAAYDEWKDEGKVGRPRLPRRRVRW